MSRSSVAPTGSSTSRAGRGSTVAGDGECGPSGQCGSGAAGSQENRQPATTSTGGSTAVSARTAVDLAVPFSPRTSTPPIAGETALSMSASRMSSIATMALNGNWVTRPQLLTRRVSAPADSADHRAAARRLGGRGSGFPPREARGGSQWRDRPGIAPEFLGSRSPAILS